jgi:hypothetical protein
MTVLFNPIHNKNDTHTHRKEKEKKDVSPI